MRRSYGVVTFLSNPMTLLGETIHVGEKAPDFTLVNDELNTVSLHDFVGRMKVISVVPSVDTGICDLQTRRINQEAARLKGSISFLSISCDLPFALKRYAASAGIQNMIFASDYRNTDFGIQYGLLIEELRILARSIIILDSDNTVKYFELVKEVACHPNYDAAMASLNTTA